MACRSLRDETRIRAWSPTPLTACRNQQYGQQQQQYGGYPQQGGYGGQQGYGQQQGGYYPPPPQVGCGDELRMYTYSR
jgi:hypothetical protein